MRRALSPKAGRYLPLPGKGDDEARLGGVLFGLEGADETREPFLPGRLAQLLPDGTYRFANEPHDARLAALAVALGACSRAHPLSQGGMTHAVKLDLPHKASIATSCSISSKPWRSLATLLIPRPTIWGRHSSNRRRASSRRAITPRSPSIIGDELLEKNFPLIHAVGRASTAEPRLIDMSWGNAKHPQVTLVGKGVCFDTGGLDIKPESSMLNMKKDMGGAATALALAHMVMSRKLKVRLRVLIPAVERFHRRFSAFRPRDIYTSRKGITVEIGNTDAEGRLVLADALTLADEDKPELIADFATLTGAARVALGPDLPAFFTDDDALASDLMSYATAENDPVWRLPLWRPYESMLESKVADTNNVGGSQGGAITAALFMRRFVAAKSWLHFDVFAWTGRGEGRPARGRRIAGGARALCAARGALRLTMASFDPRLTPARPDLAAKHLEGKVPAARFVEGRLMKVIEPQAPLRREPRSDAPLDTEALKGERVTVYDRNAEGFSWGQLAGDNYVGWLPSNALAPAGPAPTHKVAALRTFAFPGPSIKLPPLEALPFGATLDRRARRRAHPR